MSYFPVCSILQEYTNVCFQLFLIGGLVSKFKVPKIADQDIVDTSGAGDAFVGG